MCCGLCIPCFNWQVGTCELEKRLNKYFPVFTYIYNMRFLLIYSRSAYSKAVVTFRWLFIKVGFSVFASVSTLNYIRSVQSVTAIVVKYALFMCVHNSISLRIFFHVFILSAPGQESWPLWSWGLNAFCCLIEKQREKRNMREKVDGRRKLLSLLSRLGGICVASCLMIYTGGSDSSVWVSSFM